MKIAVAGGTGVVGRHVVATARAAGHETVVLSRSAGVDLMTAGGPADLAGRLAGVETVIDVSSIISLSTRASVRFFGTVTDNLLRAERDAGVSHHVALSIIGVPNVKSGHYAGKAVQEQKIMYSGGGWSILRTTQFHEFARQITERGAVAGLQIVPAMRCQPIAAAEVAAELIRIAEGQPHGLQPDLAGPREEEMAELVRRYLKATGKRKPVVPVVPPGALGRTMRDGGLLPGLGARLGTETFSQWLATETAALRTAQQLCWLPGCLDAVDNVVAPDGELDRRARLRVDADEARSGRNV